MPASLKIPTGLVWLLVALPSTGVGNVTRLDAQVSAASAQLPASAENYFADSYRYFQLARFADSISAARAAIRLRPDYALAWNNIAASYIGLGLWNDAIPAAQEALRLQPDNELARNNLAWAQLNLETTPESYLARSFRYFQNGKFEETITAAQTALGLSPGYAEAWNNIAAAYNSMSRWADAIQACEQALRLRPDFPLAKNNLAFAKAQQAKQLSVVAR